LKAYQTIEDSLMKSWMKLCITEQKHTNCF